MEFRFQKLEVYQRSLDLVEAIDSIIESVKRGHETQEARL
jgi:hypothetical protein